MQTDSLSYTLGHADGFYEAHATAAYTNRTGSPVSYARCHPNHVGLMYYLVRTPPDSHRKSFVGAPWACVGGVPTGAIPPDSQVTVVVWLGSTDSPNADPPIRIEERTGWFRIVLLFCRTPQADSDRCEWLPQAMSQSNAFEVRPPR